MTTATATHPPPAVHAYETETEMVVEVELPAGDDNVQIHLDEGLLAVTVPLQHPKQRRWNNPDATPC